MKIDRVHVADGLAPAEQVREMFAQALNSGLRPEFMMGATAEQIAVWAADQGVRTVPAAVRDVLALIGLKPGLWFADSSFGIEAIHGEAKRQALAALSKLESPLANASGILVLLAHQGYEFHVIDRRDLDLPDPPVWLVVEGKSAATHWPSVTDWLRFGAPNPTYYKFRLEFSRKRRHG